MSQNPDFRSVLGRPHVESENEDMRLALTEDAFNISEAHKRGFDDENAQFIPSTHIGSDMDMDDAEWVRAQYTKEDLWKNLNIAKATGVSFTAAAEHRNELIRSAHAAVLNNDEGLRNLIAQNPNMRKFLSSRIGAERAAMIDDKPLWNFEATGRGFFGDISYSWDVGEFQQEMLFLGDKMREGRATPEEEARVEELHKYLQVHSARRQGEGTVDWALRSMVENMPQLRNAIPYAIYRGGQGAAAGMAGGAALGMVGGPAAPVSAPAGAAAGGLLGFGAGLASGYTEKSYRDNAADVYLNLRHLKDVHTGKGMPHEDAALYSSLAGVPMGLLDAVSFGVLSKLIPGLNRLNKESAKRLVLYLNNNPTIKKAVGEAIGKGATALAAEGVTEGLQEGIGILTEELAPRIGGMHVPTTGTGEAWERVKEAALTGAVASGPLVVPGTFLRAAGNAEKVRRIQGAVSNDQAVDALYNLSANSETIANDQELAREAITYIGQATGMDTVYVKPEGLRVLFQDDEGMALAEELAITPEMLDESEEYGMDVAIPVSDAVLKLFNSRFGEQAKPFVRIAPDVDTTAELEAFSGEGMVDTQFLAFLENLDADVAEANRLYDERESLARPYVEMLLSAGYTETQAKYSIAPLISHAERFAPVFNVAPEEILTMLVRGIYLTDGRLSGEELRKARGRLTPAASDAVARTGAPIADAWRGELAWNTPSEKLTNQQGRELFQPSREEVRVGDEALRRDSDAWGKSVDKYLSGEMDPTRTVSVLQQTPLVLQMLGAENRGLHAAWHVLKDGLGKKHGLPAETMKQLPSAMADPIMVFDSGTLGGDWVMMLALKDQHGGTVVVPIALEQTSPAGYTINLATSVYGKTNEKTLKPNNKWFTNQIENGNLLYRNNKKSRDWARTVGLQLPAADSRLSTSARRRIYTEADLVKLREANPALYQSAPPGWNEAKDGPWDPRDYVYRGSQYAESPMNRDAGITMWAYGGEGRGGYEYVYHYGRYDINKMWRLDVTDAPHIEKLMPEIIRKIEEDVHEILDGGAIENTEMSDIIQYLINEKRGDEYERRYNPDYKEKEIVPRDIAEEIAHAFNPADIKSSAEAFDNPGLVDWLWTRVLEEKGIETLKTHDGAISFNPEAGENLAPHENDPRILYQQKGQQGARGAIHFDPKDGSAIIEMFKGKKNLSTFLHESSHLFLNTLSRAAQLPDAPQWVKDDFAAIQDKYGFSGFDIPTEAHEAFARSGEAYFRTGEAPAEHLRPAFRQFRNWLTAIYRSLKRLLGVDELDQEVKAIFDRLLATEDEIARARKSIPALPLEQDEDVTPEARTKYELAVQKAHEKVREKIELKRLREQVKAEKDIRPIIREELDQEPFYAAQTTLKEAGGLSFESLLAAVSEEMAWNIRNKYQGESGLVVEGGAVSVEDAALDAGYADVPSYVGVLMSEATRQEAEDARVSEALAEWGRLFDAEMEANAVADDMMAAQLEALTGDAQPSGAALRRRMEARAGLRKSSEVDAEYKALKENLRKQNAILKPVIREYEAALKATQDFEYAAGVLAGEMHRGAKDAKKIRGLREKLVEALRRERIKRAALAADYRARIERDKLIRQMRKEAKSGSVPKPFKNQLLALIAHWKGLGVEGMTPEDPAAVPTLRDFAAGYNDLFGGQEAVFGGWLTDMGQLEPGKEYASDLSLEQVREVARAVKIIAHQGRNYNKFLAFKQAVAITEAATECMVPLNSLADTRSISDENRARIGGQVRSALRGMLSASKVMRYVFGRADGYLEGNAKDSGPHYKFVIDILQSAMGRELALKREFSAKLTHALKPFIGKDLRRHFTIEGVPLAADVRRKWGDNAFTKEKVIAIAMNMGNEGNITALLRGYGWEESHLDAISGRLTREEWTAVQQIWDIIDTLYPEINAAYKAINGVDMGMVERKARVIQAADGEIEIRGGYYPLIFDQSLSDPAKRNESLDALNRMEGVFRTPKPKSGFTNDRIGGTLPPLLSLNILQQHVNDSIHYATHAPALRDINQLFNVPEYRESFILAMGQESYDALLPWLRWIARPEGPKLNQIENAVEWLAKRGTLFALGLNFRTALLQFTSAGSSIQEIGATHFASGVFQMMTRRGEAFAAVDEKSAYMQSRGLLLDSQLAAGLDQLAPAGAKGMMIGGKFYTMRDVQDASLVFIRWADASVAYPTFIGAYDKAIGDGHTEEEAVRRAEAAVIKAQGSGGTMDVPAYLRSRGFVKLLTAFMTFASNDLNRKMYYASGFREYLRGGNSQISTGVYMRHVFLEYLLPVSMSVFLLAALRDGKLPEKKDFVWELLGFTSMGIPIVRDAIRLSEGLTTGRGYGTRMGASPAYAGIENAIKGGMDIYAAATSETRTQREKAQLRAIKEVVNSVGFFAGLPTPQLWRTIEGSTAYFVDGAGGPLSPVLGKPQK